MSCQCGNAASYKCANCKKPVCDDINCGMDTVDGYLCGEYTQWGCGKKYTTCDECEEKAIHEGDFVQCDECSLNMCETCAEDVIVQCDGCDTRKCKECSPTVQCKICSTTLCTDCMEGGMECESCKGSICEACIEEHVCDGAVVEEEEA